MPRGKRKVTPETLERQINNLKAEIESYQQKIREAKDKMKKLKDQKEKQDIKTLYSAVRDSGKSVEEFLQQIKDQQVLDKPKAVE